MDGYRWRSGDSVNQYLTAPRHIQAVDVGPATVIVNYRSGLAEILIGPAARWWAELAISGDVDMPCALDPVSARRLRGQLLDAGLLAPTMRPEPWPAPTAGPAWTPSWGTHELAAGRPEPVSVPFATTVLAGLALAAVLATLAAEPNDPPNQAAGQCRARPQSRSRSPAGRAVHAGPGGVPGRVGGRAGAAGRVAPRGDVVPRRGGRPGAAARVGGD
jgi:hypothetical protein